MTGISRHAGCYRMCLLQSPVTWHSAVSMKQRVFRSSCFVIKLLFETAWKKRTHFDIVEAHLVETHRLHCTL